MSRDILDLAEKSFGEGINTMTPELWHEIGLFSDFDVFSRGVDGVGLSLAIQCAAVKARDIAKAGMCLWRKQKQRWSEVEPKRHWFAKMLARRPNSIHTWREFWMMTVLHLEIAQNAYILKVIDQTGNVLELLPLQPARVRMRVSEQGNIFYEISAVTEYERAQLKHTNIVVPASRIIHIRGKMLDGLTGISSAMLGNPIFQLIGAINAYQTKLFENDGKQPIVFETEKDFGTADMANAAFNRLKDQLTEGWRKTQATGKPLLLEAGIKAKSIAVNSKDALTTEAYKQMVERICGLMEVPPHKIYHFGDGAKYNNMAQADNQYAADCLIPIADNIEEKFRNALLEEDEWDEFWPEFDRERMTASDAEAINNRLKVGMLSGIMMINEGRERLGMNPVDGGNVFMIPVNMALMDEKGEIIHQAASGQTSGNQETDNSTGGDDRKPRLAVDNT